MNYYISVDSNGNITAQYAGPMALPSPWISVNLTQYASIVPGSTWSGSAVAAPAVPVLGAQQQLAKQAQALIGGGLTITSTGTPALNGTYACDSRAQANMLGVVSYINANGKFPGSTGTLIWYDMSGQSHVFSAVDEFMALYTAGLDFVMDCKIAADAGTGTFPAATATIP